MKLTAREKSFILIYLETYYDDESESKEHEEMRNNIIDKLHGKKMK